MDDVTRIMATGGGLSALLAVFAWYADRRRTRRRDLDRVGFMPWTGLFFWALMAAVLLLGLAARGLTQG